MKNGRLEVGDKLIVRAKNAFNTYFLAIRLTIEEQGLCEAIQIEFRATDRNISEVAMVQVVDKKGKIKEFELEKDTTRWILANLNLLKAEGDLLVYKPKPLKKLEDCL